MTALHILNQQRTWAGLLGLSILLVVLARHVPILGAFPNGLVLNLSSWLNAEVTPILEAARPLGMVLSAATETPLAAIRSALAWTPWPATVLAVTVIALHAGGARLALFTAAALGVVVAMGYWPKAMNTLALVMISVPMAIGIGFALGALAHRLPRAQPALIALLDVMQTWPALHPLAREGDVTAP